MYSIVYTKKVVNDIPKLKAAKLENKAKALIDLIRFARKTPCFNIPYLKTKMPSLWTNSYFVSTVGGAPLEVIKQYIENQKTSQRQKDKQG
jgi:putative transposase